MVKTRTYSPYHLACLCEGNFWIEEDWTEKGFANYLLEKGVSKEEVVLAFHPPQMRPLTDFAVI